MEQQMQLWLALIVALLGSAWVYLDARSRGVSLINCLGWTFLTFLAVIVGLPLYFLLRPRGKLIKCRQCKRSRLSTLESCPFCGFHDGEAEVNEVVEKTVSAGIKMCGSCGKIIEKGLRCCPYCRQSQ